MNKKKLSERELLGHPIGLFILFFTEMWERFSFYGMKALLIFYLTKYYLFSDESGNLVIGSYAALVYGTPVIGGFLADKYLGFKKAIVFGGILLVIGHLGMTYEGFAAHKSVSGVIVRDDYALQILYLSLAFIALGVGFLKANISSLVGELYQEADPRRDSGFTIFYMGINLGSLLATLICVWLGETYGWKYGFGSSGIGMLLGLIVFLTGRKFLKDKGNPTNEPLLFRRTFGISTELWIYTCSIFSILIIWQMLQKHSVVQNILLVAGSCSLIYIIYFSFTKLEKVARERLFALTILILFTVVFWALFEQAYTSLNLFADRALDRTINGYTVPAGQFLSLNALFIILFAPLFAWIWVKLGKLNPTTSVKFSIALLLVGFGFGALVLGINFSELGKVGALWLVLTYFLHTCAELCLSPVGLSAVTKLSPAKIGGFMMGVWFLATASSEYIASLLANISAMDTENVTNNLVLAKKSYLRLFEYLFYAGIAFGVLLFILSPLINKLMHGADKDLN